MRRPPNILITGTPGTGKSSLAESLQHNFDGLTHLNISEIIKERKLGESHNSEWDTWEFDDDKVPSRLEKKVTDFRFWIVLRERR
jgi:adenylate kinase